MRFHTAITASRKTPPKVEILTFPNPDTEPEIKISFGGLGVWLSVAEADDLGKALIEAGIAIRSVSSPGDAS